MALTSPADKSEGISVKMTEYLLVVRILIGAL